MRRLTATIFAAATGLLSCKLCILCRCTADQPFALRDSFARLRRGEVAVNHNVRALLGETHCDRPTQSLRRTGRKCRAAS